MSDAPIHRLLTLVLLAALGATPIGAQENLWQSESFLSDYTLLKPVPTTTGREFGYTAPGIEEKLGRFDSIMVDQPEISISATSPYRSAKPDDLRAISELVRNAIVDRLKARGFKIVEQAGPNVLFLRVALTDMQLSKKKRSLLTYTPAGVVLHGVKSAVQGFMHKVDIIDMTGEAEITASESGELLGEIVSMRSIPADTGGDDKLKPMTFDVFKGRIEEYSDRLACRLDNGRRSPAERIDCSDPAARAARLGPPTGT